MTRWQTGFVLLTLAGAAAFAADALPKHQLPPSKDGSLVIGNCDGKSSVEIKGKKEGEMLSGPEAQAVADQLMDKWLKQHPNAEWTVAANEANPGKEKGPSVGKQRPGSDVVTESATQQKKERKVITKQSGVYSDYSQADRDTWASEQDKLVKLGDEIFHDPVKLGSKTGMACAMCHPNGSNTHPETYPKYQVQLQRVAMLRDMINWCIENPVKGPLLKDDDPKMRALEAYIISNRRGVAMEPGKH